MSENDTMRPCSLVQSRCRIFEEFAARHAHEIYSPGRTSWRGGGKNGTLPHHNPSEIPTTPPPQISSTKELEKEELNVEAANFNPIDDKIADDKNCKIDKNIVDEAVDVSPYRVSHDSTFKESFREEDKDNEPGELIEAFNEIRAPQIVEEDIYEEISPPIAAEPIYEVINQYNVNRYYEEDEDEGNVEDEDQFDEFHEYHTHSDSFDDDTEHETDVEPEIDSTESIYSTGNLPNNINELWKTEEDYIRSLETGIENYVTIMDAKDIPPMLRGQKYHIFGVIEKIYHFHKHHFFPLIKSCDYDVKLLAETFKSLIEKKQFYIYVMYAMNKPRSDLIARQHLQFFEARQQEINDKLGVFSFLMQPIQRLPKYRLLLNEMIKGLMRSDRNSTAEYKLAMAAACIAEKELNRLLEAANGAVALHEITFEENNYVNIWDQGLFIKASEFDINEVKAKKKYRGKLFLFEKSVIYTEYKPVDDRKIIVFNGIYRSQTMGIEQGKKQKFKLFVGKSGNEETEFLIVEGNTDWYSLIREMLMKVIDEEKEKIILKKERRDTARNSVRSSRSSSTSTISTISDLKRGSELSLSSGFYSNRSSSISSDSYEINRTTWKDRKDLETLCNSEKYYLLLLVENNKYYLNEFRSGPFRSINFKSFVKSFDRIFHFHTKFLYPELKKCGTDMSSVLNTFSKFFKENRFDYYITYSVLASFAGDYIEEHHSRPRNESEGVVFGVRDFVGFPVKRLKEYVAYIELFEKQLTETGQWNCDLFKQSAVLKAELSHFQKNVEENFKLYSIKQTKVKVAPYGKIEYSDLVSLDVLGQLNHRIFIMEEGLICVRIKDKKSEEVYKEIVFNVPFSVGLTMRGNKKTPKKLNFDTSNIRGVVSAITFRNSQKQQIFCRNVLKHLQDEEE